MKSTLFIVCLFFALIAQAQDDYAFRVLANKGVNQVKSGDTWQPLKTGTQLNKNDELKVAENSSVGLVSKNGKPLEVKEAKTYKVVELLAKVGSSTSVLNKYTDFILSSNSDDARKNRLAATGAVHRGGTEDIKILLPENQDAEIFSNIAIFRWETTNGKAPYIVSVKDLYDVELLKIETNEALVKIDLNDPKIAKESAVLIDIVSKADNKSKSEQRLIKRLSPPKQEQINKIYTEATADLKAETAFNKYLLAGFYEENHLLIDAIACYEQAIKIDSENPTYKDAYEEFLLRNKLKTTK